MRYRIINRMVLRIYHINKVNAQMQKSLSSFPDNNWQDMDRATLIFTHCVAGMALGAVAPAIIALSPRHRTQSKCETHQTIYYHHGSCKLKTLLNLQSIRI
jgi:hypothetical protein